jgi:hypothetical protein
MPSPPVKASTLTIIPGSTFTQTLRYQTKATADTNAATPVDLTNYTIQAAAKIVPDEETLPSPDAGADIVFTVTKTTPQTGSNTGKFTLSLTTAQTQEIGDLHGQDALFRYDLSLLPASGDVVVPVYGFVRIYAAISPVTP